jgi:hypothetical protein
LVPRLRRVASRLGPRLDSYLGLRPASRLESRPERGRKMKLYDRNSVSNRVWARVRNRAWCRVWDRVWDRVRDRVRVRVRDRAWGRVWRRIR